MSLPNSVVRRYTPPTCTLEIAAKESPLSRWVGQPVLKHLRFHLSFDDPRLSEDHWVKVQGDRTQLEALYEAVMTYVQAFLSQSAHFLTKPALDETVAIDTTSPAALVNLQSTAHLDQQMLVSGTSPTALPLTQPPKFHLKPKGLLSHELSLGPLATAASGATIQLSAVQLADLATALDEYRTDVTALPNLNRPSWVTTSPGWARVAAVVLILIGGSTSLVRLFEPNQNPKTTSPTSSQGASSADQRLAVQPLSTPTPTGSSSIPPLVVTPPPPNGKSALSTPMPSPPSATSPIKLPIVAIPQTAPTTPDPEQATLKIAAPLPAARSAGVAVPALTDAEPRAMRRDRAAPPALSASQVAPSASSPAQENETAFDTTPQVAEVRNYFQTKWKAPESLAEPLQYSLVITPSGAVQQITPLGKVSEDFRDRVPLPPEGVPFLSPTKSSSNLTIRVLLNPDGKVQTFAE